MKILKGFFALLNVAAALLLLLSTLAGSVPPSSSVWVSLLGYGYFPLLLLNVAFSVVWLLASSKWFLLSAACIVLRASFVPIFFQLGGSQEPRQATAPDELGVMTYNVHYFAGRDFVSAMDGNLGQMDSNARQFLAMVDSVSPSVLMLQEFSPVSHRTRVADSLAARGYQHVAVARQGYGLYGTVMFSRLPMANVRLIDSAQCLCADVAMGDDTVRLFNLHLRSYQLDEMDYKHLNATRHGEVAVDSLHGTLAKLRSTVLAHEREWGHLQPLIAHSPHPCVVAGDFNDTPASYFYQRARRVLRDSYRECGKGFSTTYHGKFPAFRIDYVLHGDGQETLSYRRLKSDLSDHYPVVAVLKLSDKG